ncbi:unnamed protein product [Cunninghamella echinulata]
MISYFGLMADNHNMENMDEIDNEGKKTYVDQSTLNKDKNHMEDLQEDNNEDAKDIEEVDNGEDHEEENGDDDEEEEEEEEEEDDDDDDDEEEDDEDDLNDLNELERVKRKFDLKLQRMFGGAMSEMNGQLKSIYNTLKSQDDPTMQLIALQELSEILSVSNEETLTGYFASDGFSKELVRIMKGSEENMMGNMTTGEMDDDLMLAIAMSGGFGGGGNPEIMLLACRCISNLLDAMPSAVTNVVYHGAVPVLCQKLKSIEYIDLAEQALSALEKIAAQLPRAVINEGGLSAALMYFDFFSIHSQRTSLRTAANCLRNIDKNAFSQVLEIIPTLMNTITYSDRSVVELSCLCWLRISESYRSQQDLIEKAVSTDLLKIFIDLIPVPGNPNAARPSTFMDLLRILRAIVKSSPNLSCMLLKFNIIDVFYKVLTGTTDISLEDNTTIKHANLDHKWRDSVYTILKIIIDSLPPLPKDGKFSSRRFKSSRSSENANRSDDVQQDMRAVMFINNPEMLHHITTLLIPLLLEMHTSIVNIKVRQLVTHILVKLIHFTNENDLKTILHDIPLSGYLASILTQQEHSILMTDTLYIAEMLICKLPNIYIFLFEHEGVVHEIEKLSKKTLTEKEETTLIKNDNKDTGSSVLNTPVSTEPINPLGTPSTPIETSKNNKNSSSDNTTNKNDDSDTNAEVKEPIIDNSEINKLENEKDVNDTKDGEKNEEKEKEKEKEDTQGTNSPSGTSGRRLLNREDISALLRGRFNMLQQQQQQQQSSLEIEKGIGHGSTRQYIILLARDVLKTFYEKKNTLLESSAYESSNDSTISPNINLGMQTLQQLSEQITSSINSREDAKNSINLLLDYCQHGDVSISSFELRASGLLDSLLIFLTQNEPLLHDQANNDIKTIPLSERQTIFKSIFDINKDDHYKFISMFIIRLQELLARFEQYEVVTPLDITSSDNVRNASSVLAKQLRLRLSGTGSNIIPNYAHLMVSTHAVATFRVIEEYLLSRFALLDDDEGDDYDDDDDDDDDEEEDADDGADDVDDDFNNSTQELSTSANGARRLSITNDGNVIEEGEEDNNNSNELSSNSVVTRDIIPSDEEQEETQNVNELDLDDHINNSKQLDDINSYQYKNGESSNSQAVTSGNEASTSSSAKSKGHWCIKFSINSKIIPSDTTIYGAIHKSETEYRLTNPTSLRNIWISSYPVEYQRVWVEDSKQVNISLDKINNINQSSDGINNDNNNSEMCDEGSNQNNVSLESTLTTTTKSDEFDNVNICNSVLGLLKAFHSLYSNNEHDGTNNTSKQVEFSSLFLNRKLIAKVNRQLEEYLIVASSCVPTWLYSIARETPFLLPFETRFLFIQSTSYGYTRLISRWQSLQMRNQHMGARGGISDESQQHSSLLGRLERQKVRIMRNQMLESAIKMLELLANSNSVIEIEYVDEEGTGLGPTLEFYSVTSKEFCKKSLGLWRDDDDNNNNTYPQEHDNNDHNLYVYAPNGLFPQPLIDLKDSNSTSSSNIKRILSLFKTLGRFVARAMLDFRIIDMQFSVAFFKLVFSANCSPIELICQVDPVIGKSIKLLQSFVDKKQDIYNDTSLTSSEKQEAVKNIQIDGITIDDLCLYFTVPGSKNNQNLKSQGDEVPVTIQNVSEYLELLIDTYVGSGVSKQIDAFRSGFNECFPIDDLKILTYEELVLLFGTFEEDWSLKTLEDSIKADHGFTMQSHSVKNLLEILSELDLQGRRDFLQFTTGSPRLPIGGWKALRPLFTVVRKVTEAPLKADDYLPSVMTCANYFKMPDYTDKAIMLQRLRTAIAEGKDSFLLS